MIRARRHGHLLLVWRGLDLTAIDLLARTSDGKPRVLWTQDLTPEVPGSSVALQGIQPRVFFVPGMIPVLRATDQFGRPLGKLGPTNNYLVCFQRMRDLVAVEPLTGEELWRRHDVEMGSQLFGDAEHILAIAPGSNEARVFRSDDGREIGTRNLPGEEERVRLLGRNVITWRQNEKGSTLSLLDPLEQRELWTRQFTATAKLWKGELDRIAVMEPAGEFTLLDVPTGRLVFQAQLQPEAKLEELHVLPRGERTIVIASGGPKNATMVMPIAGAMRTAISGQVYGLDTNSGRKLWQTKVENQCLLEDMGAGLPLVVFACRIRETDKNGRSRYFSRVLCLDERNGHELFEESVNGTINRVELETDPEDHTIIVRTSRGSTRLNFTGK